MIYLRISEGFYFSFNISNITKIEGEKPIASGLFVFVIKKKNYKTMGKKLFEFIFSFDLYIYYRKFT